jgi:hypothetical protein
MESNSILWMAPRLAVDWAAKPNKINRTRWATLRFFPTKLV